MLPAFYDRPFAWIACTWISLLAIWENSSDFDVEIYPH
jgi:hypothetical protein